MGQGPRDERGVGYWSAALALGCAWFGSIAYGPDTAVAMHEIDHRFTVEGHVCKADGQPAAEAEVIVRDARVSVGTTVFTDSRGYYKGTLHLHNDNRGDAILITALEQEKKVTAQFDPKDVQTERKVTVNIGAGCDASGEASPRWMYYGAGIGLAAVAAFVGARLIGQRRHSQKRGKGPRK